jgi:molybdenum cofactor guanylyltransferase
MTTEGPATYGLVLAGGLARRMGGGDKGLIGIGHATMLDRVLERFRPQCSGVLINANGDASRFARFGAPVVPDDIPGFAGPLAGLSAGLDWVAGHQPGIEWVASVPGDCPFLPRDLVWGLHWARAARGAPLACARSGNWRQPVIGIWPVGLRHELRRVVVEEGLRKIESWTARYDVAVAEWPVDPVDPFFNVNTPQDASQAARLIALADGESPQVLQPGPPQPTSVR